MTNAVYLEHYLDSLESLPVELQRNFTLMRDLDSRAQSLMREIDSLADEYMKVTTQLSSDKRKEHTEKIQKLFNKAKEYGDDKVQLAIQTYELVDKHIRRLDSDLARFESEIKEKSSSAAQSAEEDSSSTKRGRKKNPNKQENKRASKLTTGGDSSSRSGADDGTIKKKSSKKSGTATASSTTSETNMFGLNTLSNSAEALDMPVDPNEPTYCLCHQVSYGEMIGCDNPDCPIEWFHFACVGLTTKPKGKWFCPKCSADRKKK